MCAKLLPREALTEIEPPDTFMSTCQKVVNLLAKSLHVPAALVMRIHADELEVFVSSQNGETPYQKGERVKMDTGVYCEKVISTHKELLVTNALMDPEWDRNPDIELGMIAYCGLPVYWPNGDIFGTICILDIKENKFSAHCRALLKQFRELIEVSLEIVYEKCMVETNNRKLVTAIEQGPSSVIITDPDGKIEYVNSSFEKITGYTFDEVLRQNPRNIVRDSCYYQVDLVS